MARTDRPTSNDQLNASHPPLKPTPHHPPSIHSLEHFPPLGFTSPPGRRFTYEPFTYASIASSSATATTLPKTTLLSLPTEILSHILHHTIPSSATTLHAFALRPKSSTLNLQLVSRQFKDLVQEQLFRHSPLKIHLLNPILHNLLTHDPAEHNDSYPCIYELSRAIFDFQNLHSYRMQNFSKIPLHRFRRIEVHVVPQLSALNLPTERLEEFFPELLEGNGMSPWTEGEDLSYERMLQEMKGSLLDDGGVISEYLERHLEDFSDQERYGRTDIQVLCHDSAEALPFNNGEYELNSLPGAWGAHLPKSLREMFEGPRVPIWESEEVWELLERFRWIGTRLGGCPTRSLFETVTLPSLLCHHRISKRTPVEWHAFLRQKAVYVWRGEPDVGTFEEQAAKEYQWLTCVDTGVARPGGDKEFLLRNLDHRLIPSARLLYAEHVKECETNCSVCTSDEYLGSGLARESDDAFQVEVAHADWVMGLNTVIERQLRDSLPGWPYRFAREQQALLLNLRDLQTELLLRKHRKTGHEAMQRADLAVKNWIAVKNRCERIVKLLGVRAWCQSAWQRQQRPRHLYGVSPIDTISLVPSEFLKEKARVWREIFSLTGRMTSDEVRQRLGWCQSENGCQHWNHWWRAAKVMNRAVEYGPHLHPAVIAQAILTLGEL